MKQSYLAGDYINYPCQKCGQKMQLTDDLIKLSPTDEVTIECKSCQQKKEYKVSELKALINAKY
mgnify:CR=1 FL=1